MIKYFFYRADTTQRTRKGDDDLAGKRAQDTGLKRVGELDRSGAQAKAENRVQSIHHGDAKQLHPPYAVLHQGKRKLKFHIIW